MTPFISARIAAGYTGPVHINRNSMTQLTGFSVNDRTRNRKEWQTMTLVFRLMTPDFWILNSLKMCKVYLIVATQTRFDKNESKISINFTDHSLWCRFILAI